MTGPTASTAVGQRSDGTRWGTMSPTGPTGPTAYKGTGPGTSRPDGARRALRRRRPLAPTSPGRGGRVVYALAWLNVAVHVLEVLAR